MTLNLHLDIELCPFKLERGNSRGMFVRCANSTMMKSGPRQLVRSTIGKWFKLSSIMVIRLKWTIAPYKNLAPTLDRNSMPSF